MKEIEIRDRDNKVKGKMEISADIFGRDKGEGIVHSVVVGYLANKRQGTHETKTRDLVSGGGKKPYNQKKTGRARHGSSRSPLFRKGGIVFGPHPRDYRVKMSSKVKQVALKEALSIKFRKGEILVVEDIVIEKIRTKSLVEILKGLELKGKKVLIVIGERDDKVYYSGRNIKGVSIVRVEDLNAYIVMLNERIIFTEVAMSKLKERGLAKGEAVEK